MFVKVSVAFQHSLLSALLRYDGICKGRFAPTSTWPEPFWVGDSSLVMLVELLKGWGWILGLVCKLIPAGRGALDKQSHVESHLILLSSSSRCGDAAESSLKLCPWVVQ